MRFLGKCRIKQHGEFVVQVRGIFFFINGMIKCFFKNRALLVLLFGIRSFSSCSHSSLRLGTFWIAPSSSCVTREMSEPSSPQEWLWLDVKVDDVRVASLSMTMSFNSFEEPYLTNA